MVLEEVHTQPIQTVGHDCTELVEQLREDIIEEITELQRNQGIEIDEWRSEAEELRNVIKSVAENGNSGIDEYMVRKLVRAEIEDHLGPIHTSLRDLKNDIKEMNKETLRQKKETLALRSSQAGVSTVEMNAIKNEMEGRLGEIRGDMQGELRAAKKENQGLV